MKYFSCNIKWPKIRPLGLLKIIGLRKRSSIVVDYHRCIVVLVSVNAVVSCLIVASNFSVQHAAIIADVQRVARKKIIVQ